MYSNALPAGLLFLAILVYFPSAPSLPPRCFKEYDFYPIAIFFNFIAFVILSLSSTVERLDFIAGFKEVQHSCFVLALVIFVLCRNFQLRLF